MFNGAPSGSTVLPSLPSCRHLQIAYTSINSGLPTMFGVAVYAFEGIGIVIPSETAITKPEKYKRVLMIALILSSLNYILFGSLCYIGFGRDTQDQILVNIKAFAGDSLAWQVIVKIITAFLVGAIAMSYPLQLFVATDILEEKIFNQNLLHLRSSYWLQNVFRACIVLFTALVAVSVPKFGLLVGLIGAAGSAALQVRAPTHWLFHSSNLFFSLSSHLESI